eukprot:GHVN01056595.1.p1 GENE.GHVN01056595.1~~GHVN01056595.1.p1  ORF type:complete len:812 (-),score=120.37 GHVN01056595.1:811-3246(-)
MMDLLNAQKAEVRPILLAPIIRHYHGDTDLSSSPPTKPSINPDFPALKAGKLPNENPTVSAHRQRLSTRASAPLAAPRATRVAVLSRPAPTPPLPQVASQSMFEEALDLPPGLFSHTRLADFPLNSPSRPMNPVYDSYNRPQEGHSVPPTHQPPSSFRPPLEQAPFRLSHRPSSTEWSPGRPVPPRYPSRPQITDPLRTTMYTPTFNGSPFFNHHTSQSTTSTPAQASSAVQHDGWSSADVAVKTNTFVTSNTTFFPSYPAAQPLYMGGKTQSARGGWETVCGVATPLFEGFELDIDSERRSEEANSERKFWSCSPPTSASQSAAMTACGTRMPYDSNERKQSLPRGDGVALEESHVNHDRLSNDHTRRFKHSHETEGRGEDSSEREGRWGSGRKEEADVRRQQDSPDWNSTQKSDNLSRSGSAEGYNVPPDVPERFRDNEEVDGPLGFGSSGCWDGERRHGERSRSTEKDRRDRDGDRRRNGQSRSERADRRRERVERETRHEGSLRDRERAYRTHGGHSRHNSRHERKRHDQERHARRSERDCHDRRERREKIEPERHRREGDRYRVYTQGDESVGSSGAERSEYDGSGRPQNSRSHRRGEKLADSRGNRKQRPRFGVSESDTGEEADRYEKGRHRRHRETHHSSRPSMRQQRDDHLSSKRERQDDHLPSKRERRKDHSHRRNRPSVEEHADPAHEGRSEGDKDEGFRRQKPSRRHSRRVDEPRRQDHDYRDRNSKPVDDWLENRRVHRHGRRDSRGQRKHHRVSSPSSRSSSPRRQDRHKNEKRRSSRSDKVPRKARHQLSSHEDLFE